MNGSLPEHVGNSASESGKQKALAFTLSGRDPLWCVESGCVERAEAEAILDGDRETAVGLLLRVGELVEANRRLEARVSELERRLSRNSRNSSLPPSQDPAVGAAAPEAAGRVDASGAASSGTRAAIGRCFHLSGSTRSSSAGRSGVQPVRTSSPRGPRTKYQRRFANNLLKRWPATRVRVASVV